MLRISVITAVRNGGSAVLDTVRSVAAQTHPLVEHVVQDANSSDGTPERVLALNSHRVRLVSERDTGIYDGFNRGLARATGDVVAFLNADDVYVDNDVLRRVATIMLDPSIDMAYADVELVHPAQPEKVVRYYRSGYFTPKRLRRGFMPAHPALFVRRRLYDEIGGFDPSYRIAGDFEWVARAFVRANPHCTRIPMPLVRMALGGRSNAGLGSMVTITRELYRACHSNDISTTYFLLSTRFITKFFEYFHRPT